MEEKTINGRRVWFYGQWYIAFSEWDNSRVTMTSCSAGKWHTGSRKQIVLEGAKKRIPFIQHDPKSRESAVAKLLVFIEKEAAEQANQPDSGK